MNTKLLAATLCTLALAACDFEQRPDSAPDQTGPDATRSAPGAAPMTPATPPASGANPASPPASGVNPATPPAGGTSGGTSQ